MFVQDADRSLFLGYLADALAAEGCLLHAYVLMTNHVHLLLGAMAVDAIPRLMQALGRRYVRHVNGTYRRTGTFWEGRYQSTILDSETYVLACHRYVGANPLRALMVSRAEDYRWQACATPPPRLGPRKRPVPARDCRSARPKCHPATTRTATEATVARRALQTAGIDMKGAGVSAPFSHCNVAKNGWGC